VEAEAEAESEAEAEAEAPKATAFWQKRLKISASTLFQCCCSNFSRFLLTRSYFFQILFDVHLDYVQIVLFFF
jgi:hypothetical protein